MKKIILSILLIAIITALITLIAKGLNKDRDFEEGFTVVVTSFVAYDFVRQIAGDEVNVINLLNPGVEMHSYDPSPVDLVRIQQADLFIYIGGNIESWTEQVLETLDTEGVKVLRLADAINLIENPHHHDHDDHSEDHHHEEEHDSHHHEEEHDHSHHEHGEYDEHIWTSLENAIKMVQVINEKLNELKPESADVFNQNAKKYIEQIEELQQEIRDLVESSARRELVFGDRMPMQYFLNEFGLTAEAAFSGCSTDIEPGARVVADLVHFVREHELPVVLYLELGTGRIARTIAEEAGVETISIHGLHNVSRTDFENNETYVSLMRRNLETLRIALN